MGGYNGVATALSNGDGNASNPSGWQRRFRRQAAGGSISTRLLPSLMTSDGGRNPRPTTPSRKVVTPGVGGLRSVWRQGHGHRRGFGGVMHPRFLQKSPASLSPETGPTRRASASTGWTALSNGRHFQLPRWYSKVSPRQALRGRSVPTVPRRPRLAPPRDRRLGQRRLRVERVGKACSPLLAPTGLACSSPISPATPSRHRGFFNEGPR